MFDIHSHEHIETLLTHMQWLGGADAIYKEGMIQAHIRIDDIEVGVAGISARARLLRPLACSALEMVMCISGLGTSLWPERRG